MRAENSGKKLVDRLFLIALERIDIVVYILYRNVHEYGSYKRKLLVVRLSVPVLGISEFNALYEVYYVANAYRIERGTDSEKACVSAFGSHYACDVSRYFNGVYRLSEEFFIDISLELAFGDIL